MINVGFRITFIGLKCDKFKFEERGFKYHIIAEHIFPDGGLTQGKAQHNKNETLFVKIKKSSILFNDFDKYMQNFAEEIQGKYDLVISDALDYHGPLVAAKAKIPMLLLHTSLPFSNSLSPCLRTNGVPRLDGSLRFKDKYPYVRWNKLIVFNPNLLLKKFIHLFIQRIYIGKKRPELERFNFETCNFPRPMDSIRENYPPHAISRRCVC